MNITRCSIISRRRAERDNGERCFFRGLRLRENDAITQKKRKKHHMPDMCRAYEAYEAYEVLFRDDCIACGLCGDVLRRPRGLGGDFEFLPLKSPRNPITPIKTSRVATLHPGLYKNLREGARRGLGATAKPLYPIDGKAAGLDRRSPHTSLIEGGGPPAAVEGVRVQCLSILYTFVPICDSNKNIKNIVNPCFSKKHHMPDMCRAYNAYEAYEVYAVMVSMIVLMVSQVSSKVMSFA